MADLTTRGAAHLLAAVVGAATVAAPLRAQRSEPDTSRRPVATPLEATAGSELEKYTRALQLVGALSDRSVTRRGYAPRTLDGLRAVERHPWERFAFAPATSKGRAARLDVLPVRAWSVFNQTFPFSYGDGAVWSGRGFTQAITAGVAGQIGPLTVVLQPVAFSAQNRAFALAPVRGGSPYADPAEATNIDLPQRFGDRAYRRVDLGQSTIRVDVGPLAAGVSTAAESWGPGVVHPLLMGQNAPGFRHAFVGTSGAQWIGIGRLNVELVVGRPADSPYAPVGSPPRYLAGGVASYAPRGVPGLEVGGGRVFHRRVPDGGVPARALFAAFENFFLTPATRSVKDQPTDPNYTPDNQLASVFASWSHATSGLRLYGELLKNDHNLDLREFATEPDHDSAILLGVEQALQRGRAGGPLTVLRVESVNARVTHLNRIRAQSTAYQHGVILQGHTNRGQLLGSTAVQGGGGQHAAVDRYTARGRLSLIGDRIVRRAPLSEGASRDSTDVQFAAAVEAVRFRRALDLFGRARLIRELNRDYAGDATSWQLLAGVVWRPNVHVGRADGVSAAARRSPR